MYQPTVYEVLVRNFLLDPSSSKKMIEYLLCTKHCDMSFTYIIIFHLHNCLKSYSFRQFSNWSTVEPNASNLTYPTLLSPLCYFLTRQKGLCTCDQLKGLETGRLTWTTQVGPGSSRGSLEEGGRLRARRR